MPRSTGVLLPALELEVLEILWSRGECTVRDIHEELAERGRPGGYTKRLVAAQRLMDRGLVTRRSAGRSHAYRATAGRDEVVSRSVEGFLDQLVDRFGVESLEALAAQVEERRRR